MSQQQQASNLLIALGRHPQSLPATRQGFINILTTSGKVSVRKAPQLIEYFANHFQVIRFDGEACVWDKIRLEKLVQSPLQLDQDSQAPNQSPQAPNQSSQAPSKTQRQKALGFLTHMWRHPGSLPKTFEGLFNTIKACAEKDDAAATKMANCMVWLGAVSLEDSKLCWNVDAASKLVTEYKKKVAAWVIAPPLVAAQKPPIPAVAPPVATQQLPSPAVDPQLPKPAPITAVAPPVVTQQPPAPAVATQQPPTLAVDPPVPKPSPIPAAFVTTTGLESSLAAMKINPTTTLVDDLDQLEALKTQFSWWSDEPVVALDLEGVPSAISLIQIATPTIVYVFDTVTLDLNAVCEVLRPLLESSKVVKLLHDLHKDSQALFNLAQVSLSNVFDTQLLAELLKGKLHLGFQDMLELFDDQLKHDSKLDMKHKMSNGNGGKLFAQRPIPANVLQYAVDDVKLLMQVWPAILAKCESNVLVRVTTASNLRASSAAKFSGMRSVWFDREYQLCSLELLSDYQPPATMVGGDLNSLLALLPEHLKSGVLEEEAVLNDLVDICLDKGRTALCYLSGKRRLNLGKSSNGVLVTEADIACVIDKLGGESRFGDDNRAGLERQLHRISAMRNNQQVIYGMTLRVGRYVMGLAECLCDILLGQPNKSILFVGIPGSGKTTMIRDVARLVSSTMENTCIIDTSNEIGGDSDVPHDCIGNARRMMVPSLNDQARVMIECVQNHTVSTMIIDEIGRKPEVASALTVKQRGVRLIGSVHGDFRTLLKNKDLNGLLGGVQTVTLGDAAAKHTNSGSKVQTERCGEPTFDMVIELGVDPSTGDKVVRVIPSTKIAVDAVLEGERVLAQVRRRHFTGRLLMELVQI
ncbi:hypothetical protein BASA81_002589 [Batrachochytrium salamandrivorans]|nr:hypothetical protein BASA81_002589 [Batrachochytrium salamandrivorans]